MLKAFFIKIIESANVRRVLSIDNFISTYLFFIANSLIYSHSALLMPNFALNGANNNTLVEYGLVYYKSSQINFE